MYDISDWSSYKQADTEVAELRTLLKQIDDMEMFLAQPDIDIDVREEVQNIHDKIQVAIGEREAACDEWAHPSPSCFSPHPEAVR